MQRLNIYFSRRILVSLLLAMISVTGLLAADPVLHCDDSVPVGSVLQVSVSGNNLENLSLNLVDDRDRAISRAEGFKWQGYNGSSIQVVLLGIPSTASPGNYTLVLNADQGRAEWRQEKTIRLTQVTYPERVINMSGKMDNLYSDESERKKAESRVLWTILTSVDPTAIYHVEPFAFPLEDSVPTAGFGDKRRYRMPDGSESASVHFGSDFWAEKGSGIVAPGRGRVVMATERLLTGNTVIVEHLPGVYSMYYHMDSLAVIEGEIVEQGRNLGTVGETGFATGDHLHWELRVAATPVNILEFLERPLLDTNELMSNM